MADESARGDGDWRPYWNASSFVYKWRDRADDADVDGDHGDEDVSRVDACDTASSPRKTFASAAARKVTPDDLFTVSSNGDETTKTSNKSEVSESETCLTPDEAYFARSPIPVVTPTSLSTRMSYSSSEQASSSHNHRSCITDTTMDYENSSLSTCSAVAVLYQGYVGSVASSGEVAVSPEKVGEEEETEVHENIAGAAVTPPSEKYISKGEPGTEWSTPKLLASGESTVGEVLITSGNPVLKLLEREDGEKDNLPTYHKQPKDEDQTLFTRKRLLLSLLLLLGLVCIAVGLSVTIPKDGQVLADTAAAEMGQGNQDGDNTFTTVAPTPSAPTPAPTTQASSTAMPTGDAALLVPVGLVDESTEKPTRTPSAAIPSKRPTMSPVNNKPTPKPTRRPKRQPTPKPTKRPTPAIDDDTDSAKNNILCGGGSRGIGICPNPRHCCSPFGWCGTGAAYCDD